jgi:formylglycine-generating enzyme required for sulfatase activity
LSLRALSVSVLGLSACISVPDRDLRLAEGAAGLPDAAGGGADVPGGGGADGGPRDAAGRPADAETPADVGTPADARTPTDARSPADALAAGDGPRLDDATLACDAGAEVCNGRDDDCDGHTDEEIEGCCSGGDTPPCNGCPAGTIVPAGFVCVPAGVFSMGSPDNEPGRTDREPQHDAQITRPYFVSTTEVTLAEFERAMGAPPPEQPGCGDTCPAVQVTWFSAIAYCNARSLAEGLPMCYQTAGGAPYTAAHAQTGEVVRWVAMGEPCPGYRLPTEAEWERAARGGTETPTYAGSLMALACEADAILDSIAWYCGNAGGRVHPAAGKAPNPYGLYDVLGSLWEWCWDFYAPYPAGLVPDYSGPESSDEGRVVRGGTFTGHAAYTRSAHRSWHRPSGRHADVGFRVVRTVVP